MIFKDGMELKVGMKIIGEEINIITKINNNIVFYTIENHEHSYFKNDFYNWAINKKFEYTKTEKRKQRLLSI